MAEEWNELVFAADDPANRSSLARAARRGTLMRLAPGIYSGRVGQDPADIVRRHLYRILEHARPGIVITDASARTGQPRGGLMHVAAPDKLRDLDLPGVTVRVRRGPGPVPGDMQVGDRVHLAGPARGLLDNLAGTRGAAARVLPRADVEAWIDDLLRYRGEQWLGRLRDEVRDLAPLLGREREMATLDRLIGAALGSRPEVALAGPTLAARRSGAPLDPDRVEMFETLAAFLRDQPPNALMEDPDPTTRRALLPFYEAYFSNFIEGTEFTLDEAAEIVFGDKAPGARPADAHDVLGTFALVADPLEMATVPTGPDELLALLGRRHGALLSSRPETNPGQFKERDNRAGSTGFVGHRLVQGTLRAGFAPYRRLADPFARAVYMMFFLSEVHPFADGNGRVARIFMNAELVAAHQVRLVVPTVYRDNYLDALRAASRTGHYGPLYRTMDFARRYTGEVDFTSRVTAEAVLHRTHALLDPREAASVGLRLVLPRTVE